MSLRTIGYDENGRAIRVDEGEAFARIQGYRGSMVQGGPGANDLEVQRQEQRRHRAKAKEQAA